MISALTGYGCRELAYAVMDYLDRPQDKTHAEPSVASAMAGRGSAKRARARSASTG
jgi:hypothetical protein